MATSASRDVKLTLSVDTLGQEGVKALQDSIVALAKQGGAAAPEFQRLADEVSRLGDQSAALSAFRELADETSDLTARQEAAQESSRALAARLDELRASVESTRARQEQAAAAVTEASAANVQAGAAIRLLKTEYDAAGRNTTEYRTRLAELIREQASAKITLDQVRVAQREANAEVSAAEAAQRKAEAAYTRSVAAVERTNVALAENAQQTRAAAAAAEALGVSTEDVAGSQGRIVAALNAAGTAARERKAAIDSMTESDRLLAIEEATLARAFQRGQQDLVAEIAAMQDATRVTERYAQSQREAAAAAAAKADDAAKWQREADAIVNAAEATARLNRQTDVLAATQRELAAQRAFEKQAEDARKLVAAADYVRMWTDALDKAEAETKQVQSAFNTLNIRSAETIQAEIAQTRTALETLRAQATTTGQGLAGAFTAGQSRIRALELELRTLNGTLTTGDRLAGLFKNSLGQIAAGNIIADGVGYLVNKVKELGVSFVTTIAQTEQFRRGLTAIYKDTALVQSQFEFLTKTANDAGVSVGSMQGAFVKFSAATKSANIPLTQTNALFAAVTSAAGSLGLNGEQVTGMLEALGQMASKGTVSMEELRQQLGDRLPGAFSLVAQGLGITEAQLVKLVESGSLAARDLFPALTKALGTMKGEVTGIIPAYEQLKNSLTAAAQSAGDAGWTQLLAGGLRAIAVVAGLVILPLNALMEVILGLAKAAGVLAGAVVTATNPTEELGRIAQEAAARQSKLTDAFDIAIGQSPAMVAAAEAQSQAQTSAAASADALAKATAITSAGLAAQKLQADLAGASNGNLASTYVQLSARLSENLAVLEKQSVARDKEAKAIAVEGQTLVQLTTLRGSERDSLEAATFAALNNAQALARSAESRRAEVEVLTVQRNALLALSSTSADETKARAQAIIDINKKIEVSAAEAAQADAAVAAMRNEAVVRQVQRQTYEDNSAALATLERAMLSANATLQAVTEQQRAGYQTTEQVAQAQRNAAAATALYNDALRDSVERIRAESEVKQANYNVTLATLGVQGQAYERLAAASRASGDLAMATYYEIEAKRVQIQVTAAVAAAKKAEADATIAAANAELQALQKTNSLTEAKRLEIEARLANAKAQQIEAGASTEIIRALEAEITAIRNNANARGGSRSGIDADTASRYKNRDAIDAQTAALVKQQVTSDGFKANADGSAAGTFSNAVPLNKIFEVLGNRQNLTSEDLPAVQEAVTQAINARQYLDSMRSLSAGSVSGQAYFEIQAKERALKDLLASLQGAGAPAAGGTEAAGTTSGGRASSAPAAGSSHLVKIDIGGRTREINTASASDASSLVSMLKDLQTAAGRAS